MLPWKQKFWSHLAQNLMQSIHHPNDALDLDRPAGLRDINVWKCERTHRLTDAGSSLIL